jgi:uncharacterized membrane protein YcaP (DUF421 family)
MDIDWQGMFVPTVSLWEMVLRGSAVYLVLIAMMRLFRRDSGALGTADLLVVVIIADAAQNALAADYHSLTEGTVLIATIFAWNYGLDWLSFRSPVVRKLLQPDPLLLINDGKVNRRNMRSEMLTMDDLMEQLREHGIDDVKTVRRSFLEADGHLSVLLYSRLGDGEGPPDRAGVTG